MAAGTIARAAAEKASGRAWHAMTADETVAALGVGAGGLDAGEAARRLQAHGPNELPAAEARSPLRRFIWYAFNPSTRSVMIGPVRLTRTRAQRVGNAPEALEYGGASVHAGVVYWTTGPRGGAHRHKGDVRVNIRPHPFMRPAFEKTRDKDLDKLWRNSILKAR